MELYPYQEAALEQQLKRGIEQYRSDGDLSGFRLLLGSEVGTGKTPFTIRYLGVVREFLADQGDERGQLPILVVCPASLKTNWAEEIRRWSLHPMRHKSDPLVLSGGPEKEVQADQALLKIIPPWWVIANYEYIRDHQQFFQNIGDEKRPAFLAIVADEAHHVKNAKAQRTIALRSICAWFHCALSGTLMTGFPDSIFHILEWVDNPPTRMQEQKEQQKPKCRFAGHLAVCSLCHHAVKDDGWPTGCKLWDGSGEPPFIPGRRKSVRVRLPSETWGPARTGYVREWRKTAIGFVDRYCITDQWGRITGAKNAPELHSRLAQYGLIRWRRSELDLPPLTVEHRTVELTPAQRQLYDALKGGLLAIVESQEFVMAPVASQLALLHYFRRATTLTPREFTLSVSKAAGSPLTAELLDGVLSHPFTQDTGAKQQALADLVQELREGTIHKLIVFSEWTDPLYSLPARLGLAEGEFEFITGAMPPARRQEIARQWNEDHGQMSTLFLSPAAFEGLNLQGGLKAGQNGVVVILNLPWSPHQVIQAIGRMHRAGQQGTITAILLLARNTIDQKVMERLYSKQVSIEQALDRCQSLSDLFNSRTGRTILEMV